jgi:excisionase family DNA binding protein
MDAHRWITISAAAKAFRLSPRTLRAAVRRGELAASRPGKRRTYTTVSDVEAWLRRQTVPPTPSEARARMILGKMN